MKIAIIGSGFFGSSLAMILSKNHQIDLYEKKNELMCGASRANQFRFHSGYHYPRSQKTVKEIKKYKKIFTNYFGLRIFNQTQNYYSIAAKNSKVSINQYIKFLKKNDLYFKEYRNSKFFSNEISSSFRVKEKILNYFSIKEIIKKKITKMNINLKLNNQLKKKNLKDYDKVIICKYSNNNKILKSFGINNLKKYKYELVEKIIISLPQNYKKKSFVVLDGNFVCVDPYLGTKYHLLSDVKFSKLEIINSHIPNFKHKNKRFLNKGIIKNKNYSNFEKFKKNSSKYLPFIRHAKYIGSYYVVRMLKTNVENTDERVNAINVINKKLITVLSGKWNTCVGLAQEIKKLLDLKKHD